MFIKNRVFGVVWTIGFCSISLAYGTNIFLRNVWRDFRFPMSAIATVERVFMANLLQKLIFPIGHFMLPLLMLTLEAKGLSIHYLMSIWTTYWWNLNKIVWSRTIQNFAFFDRKWLTIFDRVLTPFWKMFLWLKQLFDAKILRGVWTQFFWKHIECCNF